VHRTNGRRTTSKWPWHANSAMVEGRMVLYSANNVVSERKENKYSYNCAQ